ncbi:MAG: hypothetical protein AUJ92_05765 [Armatimonadetes bacterium CG2_30_59_28]|nr:hypothetical protein [Armatimonadota bacterium]OIO96518.1 MAG: hypothetical protein AUJ92_05765 [Armatimonadetes bacterium CG2_30_59_28]PIU64317.1 MAG: hypothetical protein COS85_12975 [Armatimonadetes bacterium CG07_land_8_20_14_0_80_59_28]PIX41253.1 MAG: hypothetical protein COZ56_12515 [Armatimonadetes bacterium CG_4_8_14_3_um_filter_58_9]PIY40881.1 MAG: hypothetical protein COZ05_16580 [Armatimonadetes bacterium CG_4_10_14_3_um_filter_59_10]PJB66112.1 MAG: hypothetical protein CO095_133
MTRNARYATRDGLTLIEFLLLLVLLSVLAFVLVPRMVTVPGDAPMDRSGMETNLKSSLARLRGSVNSFKQDCGVYPLSVEDLAASSAPLKGWSVATQPPSMQDIDPAKWKGPYLDAVPQDPITHKDFVYGRRGEGYDVWSASEESSSRGTPFSTW